MNIAAELSGCMALFCDRPAITGDSGTLTYGRVSDLANNIAGHLMGLGMKRRCIAIDIDDPSEHIIAMLGVILSGNHYISVTEENRRYLCDQGLVGVAMTLAGTGDIPASDPVEPPPAGDRDTICLFLTSGSSGEPKAVVHSFRSVGADTRRQISMNGIGPGDRIDLTFSLSFSASLSCIYPALLSGAELCVFPLRERGIGRLPEFWELRGVTLSSLSVSTFRSLCRLFPGFHHLTRLRLLSIGAEPVTEEDVELFYDRFPAGTLLQVAYATTETRTISEYKTSLEHGRVPYPSSVGRPVPGRKVLILNDSGEPAGPDETGEIVVESDTIAEGYLNQEAGAGAGFQAGDGVRRFNTGDLGWMNREGWLFFEGRKNQEIRIRGVRINPMLLEQRLRETGGIGEAAVVVNRSLPGREVVVAFLQTGDPACAGTAGELLKELFPPAWLPSLFIAMEQLPLTHTGKPDLEALSWVPLPVNDPGGHDDPLCEKETPLLTEVVTVWQEVLRTRSLHPCSHFFHNLGGDSLLAMECTGKLEQISGLTLPAGFLQQYPTPLEVARYLAAPRGQKKVTLIRITEPDDHLPDFVLISHYHPSPEVSGLLAPGFLTGMNISVLRYDIQAACSDDTAMQEVLIRMAGALTGMRRPVLAGYSFNGFMAHQLSLVRHKTGLAVLFDTPCYFDYKPYQEKGFFRFLANALATVVAERDPGLLRLMAAGRFRQLIRPGEVRQENEHREAIMAGYTTQINRLVAQGRDVPSPGDCLFIKTTRTYYNFFGHGHTWKSRFNGAFRLMLVRSSHDAIFCEKNTRRIFGLILQYCPSP